MQGGAGFLLFDMGELEIKGKGEYLKRLKKHLAKEHPKTKGKMSIEKIERKKELKNKIFPSYSDILLEDNYKSVNVL